TPAIAMLTRSLRADIGVVISASHNPFGDNGIKLFGPDGYKLSDDFEARIEAAMSKGPTRRAAPSDLGRAKRLDDAGGRYIEFVKQGFPIAVAPDGFNINRDCGALSPENMRQEVLARRADIGIALDGDADRLIVADERGVILDG